MRLSRPDFDALVESTAGRLPPRYRRYLENVAIVVADEPSLSQRRLARLRPGDLLFGLYEGVPRIARDGRPTALPDTITLFQGALEAVSPDQTVLVREIRATLIHEIGHHLGLNEARVRRAAARHR